jgi:hypothetical protein
MTLLGSLGVSGKDYFKRLMVTVGNSALIHACLPDMISRLVGCMNSTPFDSAPHSLKREIWLNCNSNTRGV